MKEGITVKQAMQEKKELESQIVAAICKFSDHTGMKVMNLDLQALHQMHMDELIGSEYIVKARVEV